MALTRGARWIILFVVAGTLASVGTVVGMLFLLTSSPDIPDDSVLWLRLPAALAERQSTDLIAQLGPRSATLGGVTTTLRMAAADDRIRTVVLAPAAAPLAFATAQELRGAIADYRASGKRIVAWLEGGGQGAYYLAAACDEIILAPTTVLMVTGVSIYEFFYRELLDKLGIHADVVHAGEFKTFGNQYSETTHTPAHREMNESLVRDIYDQLVLGLARSRGMPVADMRALIDDGPFVAKDALERGLVDDLLYRDELLARLAAGEDEGEGEGEDGEAAAEAEDEDREPVEPLDWRDYRQVEPASLGIGEGPRLAVVHVAGGIASGRSAAGVAGSDTLVEAVREAREDEDVEAIILRVNSPGGSGEASDLIWRELVLAGEEKPVVASMSNMAASGGYYVAMPADVIVAQPGTLTGSIGVVAIKPALGGLSEKLGVAVEGIGIGRAEGMFSPVDPLSELDRARFQYWIDDFYEEFLWRAAEGRGMTRDAVHAVAQGRVWTGRQARDRGLVDELGGMDVAVAEAKRLAGIAADEEVELVQYPRPRTFFETVSEGLSTPAASAGLQALLPAAALLPAGAVEAVENLVALLPRLRPGEPLALMPWVWLWQ